MEDNCSEPSLASSLKLHRRHSTPSDGNTVCTLLAVLPETNGSSQTLSLRSAVTPTRSSSGPSTRRPAVVVSRKWARSSPMLRSLYLALGSPRCPTVTKQRTGCVAETSWLESLQRLLLVECQALGKMRSRYRNITRLRRRRRCLPLYEDDGLR